MTVANAGDQRRGYVQPRQYFERVRGLSPEAAADILHEGFARFPDHLPLAHAWGDNLMFHGRFEEALRVFRRCRARATEEAAAWRDRCALGEGVALLFLRQLPQASEHFALVQTNSTSPAVRSLAVVYSARCATHAGDIVEARRLLATLPIEVADDAVAATIAAEHARLEMHLGNAAAALSHLRRALSAQGRAEFRLFKALVQVWCGEWGAAQATVAKITPETVPLFYRPTLAALSSVLEGQEARAELDQVLAQRPYDPAGWLLAAAHAWRRGDDGWRTRLEEGRKATGSTFLLDPRWTP